MTGELRSRVLVRSGLSTRLTSDLGTLAGGGYREHCVEPTQRCAGVWWEEVGLLAHRKTAR